MEKRKGASWLWAAWAVTAGGCALVAGLEPSYYVLEAGGSGGEAGGEGVECTPEGKECVKQTCVEGKCTGECGPEQVRCTDTDNRPQRCDERGRWEDAAPCGAAAPVCDAGKCVPRSCVGLAEMCGPPGREESCCSTGKAVTGGTFDRSNDSAYPATVSGFLLDRYEVTVGRFRKFVEAYPGSKPAAGTGVHPKNIAGSGWDAAWDSNLPADTAALKAAVKCDSTYQTWTDDSGANEHLPMNCLDWYVAFAFCAWDGGRLPTEAEWNYAAAGGGGADGQREYPWSKPPSSTTIDSTYAVYDCRPDGSCAFSGIQAVGSKSPKGDGKWDQADLSGNLWEWVLDWYQDSYDSPCNDCANVTSASYRVLRGGSWNNNANASDLLSSRREPADLSRRFGDVGARCARTP